MLLLNTVVHTVQPTHWRRNGFTASLDSSAFETYPHLKCQRYQGLAQATAHIVFQWLNGQVLAEYYPTYSPSEGRWIQKKKKKKLCSSVSLKSSCLGRDSEVTCHPSSKNKMALTGTALLRRLPNWHLLIEEFPGRQIQLLCLYWGWQEPQKQDAELCQCVCACVSAKCVGVGVMT